MIPALDWIENYRPAALAIWHGASPYTIDHFFAAPWAVIPLIPLALLPYAMGRWCLLIAGLCGFAYTAYRLGARPLTLAFFLLSYPVLADLTNGNIEWLAMLGFVLPPQIGLIFVLIKPQIGIGITIYWLIEAYQLGGIVQVGKTSLPLMIVTSLSFLVFGFWPLHFLDTLAMARKIETDNSIYYNASLWPFGLLIGLALLGISLIKKQKNLSIMAGPFLSPYALISTYATSLLAWIDKPWFFFPAWLITWFPFFWKLLMK
jgi:hypothetical protein